MSETKFSCPLCSQHIACDGQYGGRQIQCPSCQAAITVPAAPIAVKAVATASNVARAVSVAAKPEPTPAPPVAPAIGPGPFASASAKNPKKILTTIAAIVVGVIAIFFLGRAAIGWQAKFDEASKRNSEGGGMVGGHLSHIKTLNDVMDATDPGGNPDKLKRFKPALAPPSPPSAEPAVTNTPAESPGEQSTGAQTGAAAAWTLDIAAAQISNGPAGGSLSGGPFSADSAALDVANSLYILALRQGTNANADQALFCYLYLKPGETIAGRTWTISKDTRVGAPQVLKRWKPSFAAAAKQQTYTAGYAMKLEFGQTNGASIPGKIYIALPDPEQSCVSGEFTATMRAVTLKAAAPPPAVPAARPLPSAPASNPNAVPTQKPLPRLRNPGGYSVPFGS